MPVASKLGDTAKDGKAIPGETEKVASADTPMAQKNLPTASRAKKTRRVSQCARLDPRGVELFQ